MALFVVGQILSLAHHALVPHGQCAPGGARTHVETVAVDAGCSGHAHGHTDGRQGQEAAAESSGESRSDLPSVEDGAVHSEVCSIPTLGEVSPDLHVQPAVESWSLRLAAHEAELQSQAAQWQFPVFRLAPKQSPPHEA